ncbi:hypothetical protein [Leekyejoonella antrihumi]|uniref:Uncharacterized protein n=1 Tax=Leekyejoonella antrihumi TaxID=1660198 RepID=A0A563E5D3_9MICO|nr:hypothetical protein [Leekyejoonella antrihumi]TWP37635.1 hypothetical protein FGL98_05345 [Leekyejoonella antrihumi]
MTTATERRERRAAVHEIALRQDLIVTRTQLMKLGVSESAITAEVDAGRWRRLGIHTLCTHTGDLSQRALWRYAVWESGCAAALDGAGALQAHDLQDSPRSRSTSRSLAAGIDRTCPA